MRMMGKRHSLHPPFREVPNYFSLSISLSPPPPLSFSLSLSLSLGLYLTQTTAQERSEGLPSVYNDKAMPRVVIVTIVFDKGLH